MNTPALAAILPSAPASPSGVRGAGRGPADSEASGFSNVLEYQHSAEAGKPAVQEAGKKAEGKPGKTGEQAAEQAADDAQALNAGEQALALPQMALHIAAEVAAVQQTASGGRKLPIAANGQAMMQ